MSLSQVTDLPYQFRRVKDFEASIRAPVGRLFVPENMHRKLTVPAVKTKMGAVIEPMTENELIDLKNKEDKEEYLMNKKNKKNNNNKNKKNNNNNNNGPMRKDMRQKGPIKRDLVKQKGKKINKR